MLIKYLLMATAPLIAYESACDCPEGPRSALFTVRHIEGGGIGYPHGYTSFDLFYTPSAARNYFPFFDVRIHNFDPNFKMGSNLGLGLRYRPDCEEIFYGINAYWDFRTTNNTTFNVAGLGLEVAAARWDAHLNGYMPVDHKKRAYRTGFIGFQGNEALFYKKYEVAFNGVDASFGYLFYSSCNFDLRAHLGAYYFQGDFHKRFGGGRASVLMRMTDYVSVFGQIFDDTLEGFRIQGELQLHAPLGNRFERRQCQISCCENLIDIERQLVLAPNRFEVPPTVSHKKVTAAPQKFVFVHESSRGNGTFERPFQTIDQAMDAAKEGDAIYLLRANTDYLVLQEGQKLIGAAAPYAVQTRFGVLTIPSQSDYRSSIGWIFVDNHNTIAGVRSGPIGGFDTENLSIYRTDAASLDLMSFSGRGAIEDSRFGNVSIILEDGAKVAFQRNTTQHEAFFSGVPSANTYLQFESNRSDQLTIEGNVRGKVMNNQIKTLQTDLESLAFKNNIAQ